jgi:2'-deoxynucleoside 5'-phosphate N-hydrolase
LKVYLSVPMIDNRSLPRAEQMARAIEDSGNLLVSPWVMGPVENLVPGATNVFRRDMAGAEGCDTLVADVTEPSIGVGMEIMAAYKARRRIVLVVKRGRVISKMLYQMDGKVTVEYGDESEVYERLFAALK